MHLAADTDWRIAIAECPGSGRLASFASGEEQPTLGLEGALDGGLVTVSGTGSSIPLTSLVDGTGTATPVFATPMLARLERVDPNDAELTARLGVALDAAETLLVVRAMTPFLNEHLEFGRDGMDTNGDNILSEAEVAANSVTKSLLAPDLDIEGVSAISFGMRVHATRVR